MKSGVTALLLFGAVSAFAQMSPVGLWRNIDDKTGEVKAEIRIVESNGAVSGRIEKVLKKDAKPDEKCGKCEDDRKDKPMVGLEIIRGAKILDPENGREYRLELTPIEGGKTLQVRGFFGPFYRTQTWLRAQ
ncbi:MAG TPA: DUF2147 domain-containing protein [Ramlibacter sp.]|nr:DUF2147 domain-containing protein [Ramlibacter sp.]